MTSSGSKRTRLSPEARREQLINVALEILMTRPLAEWGVDEVAAGAEVSRGLVFHYFPTVRELRLAAMEAAASNLVAAIADAVEGADDAKEQRLAAVDAFVGFILQFPKTFDALAAMAASDVEFGIVFDKVRNQAAGLVQGAFHEELSPLQRKMVVGWVALTENVVRSWVADPEGIGRAELGAYIVSGGDAVVV